VIAAKENFPWLVAAVALLGVGLYMRKKRRG
jgi:LPXTG-motif cell wall-anchored protein